MSALAPRAIVARTVAIGLSLAASLAASSLFIQFAAADGLDAIDVVRTVLIFFSALWLAWGASQSIVGFFYRQQRIPKLPADARLTAKTAILVPIYNEDPVATFSRVAAMSESLAQLGMADAFHFAILSDTTNSEIEALERHWFERLVAQCNGYGRMFYRHRTNNHGKKAGNIEDFITRSGGAYEFALILDADSLMEGKTIVEMARRMQAAPDLGLLQSLPHIINARSRFARAMQFSAGFFSPVFARGIAMMQGREGPFWGHNAMIRTRAFAESCGLPELDGKAPFGGHILSHDYVEAALLARAGWTVRLDPDLVGSYEEGPENIIEYAKRDRRWCQGNLQHAKLLATRGLKSWSRLIFLQGILAYVASPIWALFLVSSMAAYYFAPQPDYFPEPYQLFPVFPNDETSKAIALILGIFGLLILPKLLIWVRAFILDKDRDFGGPLRTASSVLCELLLSSIIAPLMLMFQSRAVLQVLLGRDGGWPATTREGGTLRLRDAFAASNWIVLSGLVIIWTAWQFSPGIVFWILPVTLPMILSPLLIAWTSRPSRHALFSTPEELFSAPVIDIRTRILAAWHDNVVPMDQHKAAEPALEVPGNA